MSRIGRKPIPIPKGVEIAIDGRSVRVKGPKGSLAVDLLPGIDATVEDAVRRAKSKLPTGDSLTHCEECGQRIPDARREAVPGVRLCVACQSEIDEQQKTFSGYNRRGSKDSQLR